MTPEVTRLLAASGLRSGLATVSVIGSTAGLTTIEFEPGAVADLNAVFEERPARGKQRRLHGRQHEA